MPRKVKVIISTLLALLLLSAGSLSIMAQDEPNPEGEPRGLLARVAEKLGITLEELTSAFKEARQEMKDEGQPLKPRVTPGLPRLKPYPLMRNLEKLLEKAVEKELITSAEAEAIQTWWQSRPEVLSKTLLVRVARFAGLPRFIAGLEQAVARGLITAEEAEAIKTWWESRPEALEKVKLIGGMAQLKSRPLPPFARGFGRLEPPPPAP